MNNSIECNMLCSALCGCVPDREKFLGLQRRAANQSTIHVRHAEQVRGVTSLAAAAIEDAQTGRDTSIVGAHPPAYESVDLLRLLWRGGTPRPDGPDRLIGDHAAVQTGSPGKGQDGVQLARHHGFGLP